LKKLLILIVFLALLGGLGWWYFHEQALPNYGPAYREYAYVTNGKSSTVSVIDLRTFQPVKTISVGVNPTGVAANGKKNEIYVVNTGSNNISVIDTEKNAVVATIGVHGQPYFIDVSDNGKRAYVANSASANVSVIDLEKRMVLGNVRVGSGPGLARVSPDGGTVVVSNRNDNTVSLIDASSLRVRATLPVCQQPEDIAILPDSSKAFVTCSGSSQVASIALENAPTEGGKKASPLTPDRVLALLDVGRTPASLALKPDGGELIVCDFDSDSISIIETGNDEVGSSALVGQHPSHALVTRDNSRLYTTNFGSNSVAVYDIDAGPTNRHGSRWQPSGWSRIVAGSELSSGVGHPGGRRDRNPEACPSPAGADGILASNHDSGRRTAQWNRSEGIHDKTSREEVGFVGGFAGQNSQQQCRDDNYCVATALPQNLSNAVFSSAAIAAASRDSMSRRGII
jgi:YVTN family beta-propeller protein